MQRKKCGTCKRSRMVKFFNAKAASPDGLQSTCRDCNRRNAKAYYERNRDSHKKKMVAYAAKYKSRVARQVWDYLLEHPCVDCGETDPVVLDFDHVRGTKFRPISSMLANKMSWKRIQDEITKCEVRCANCHRRKTAKDFNWHASFRD